MENSNRTQLYPLVSGSFSSPRVRSYSGSYRDRQSRNETRAAMRYGDWGILAVPTPVLWFDDPYEFLPYVPCGPWGPVVEAVAVEPVIVDLWP